MQGNSPNPNQTNVLYSNLLDQLNPKHGLLHLAKVIPWNYFADERSKLCSPTGRLAQMVAGVLFLATIFMDPKMALI